MNRRRFLGALALGGAGIASSGHRSLLFGHGAGPAPTRNDAAPPTLGLNSHTYHWREPEQVEHLSRLGIRHVRITGVLQHWEGEVASYRDYMRETGELAASNGVSLLWVLHNTRGEVFSTAVDRGWWDRMGRFAAWTAGLPGTGGVQLWNEQDLWVQAPFGAGRGLPMRERGRNYARHVRQLFPRIKDANPRVSVVTGGTADHPGSGFLAGMMETPPPCDAVAIHAYGPWSDARERLVEAKRIVGSRALWVTECGSRHHSVDEATQLSDWRSTIEGNREERLAERLYLYALNAGSEAGHSMLGPGGRTRAVYRWLRASRQE